MKLTHIIAAVIAIAAVVLFLMPPPPGGPPHVMHAAGLLLLTIGLWATAVMPEHISGLMFLCLCMLFAVAPNGVVFSGFTSGTLWLVLGGLILAEAVSVTGLGVRMARSLFGRFHLSYAGLIAMAALVALLLSFLMPATAGRVLLLLPIYAAVAVRAGLPAGSPGHVGMAVTGIMVSFQCGVTVLPANAPNLVLAGAAETLYNKPIIYGDYLLLHFPVLGLLKAAIIVALVCWLFPATTQARDMHEPPTPMTQGERRLTVILLTALVLWATDFLHGIRPGWIALAAGIITLMPRIGAVPHTMFPAQVKLGAFFYVGAVLGFGAVLQDSGLGKVLGGAMLGTLNLAPDQDFLNFVKLTLLATATNLLTTNPSQPALLAPLAAQMAEATGWRIEAALMTMAVGFSLIILPYQAPPVMVGMQLSGITLKQILRLTLPLAAVCLLVLMPLDYAWWRLLGYFR